MITFPKQITIIDIYIYVYSKYSIDDNIYKNVNMIVKNNK